MPQIELMQADLPHTLYLKDKSSKGKGNTRDRADKHTKASDEVLRLQEEANRRLMEKKAKESQSEPEVTLEELFKK